MKKTLSAITNQILQECKQKIGSHLEAIKERYWKIGEELLRAKEAIVKDTGDMKAPGFKKWIEDNFPFSYETAKRYMRASREKLTDSKEIWYNNGKKKEENQGSNYPEVSREKEPEPKKEKEANLSEENPCMEEQESLSFDEEPKETVVTGPGEAKKEKTHCVFHIEVTLQTTNPSVLSFLRGLAKQEDTDVITYREHSDDDMFSSNECIKCGRGTSWKSSTGMCRECYIKCVLEKNPDVDSPLSLSERINEVQRLKNQEGMA